MSSCCDELSNQTPKEIAEEKEPDSIVGKFLHRIGKADAEKQAGHKKHEGADCCGS